LTFPGSLVADMVPSLESFAHPPARCFSAIGYDGCGLSFTLEI
jgi:hypothetical protein